MMVRWTTRPIAAFAITAIFTANCANTEGSTGATGPDGGAQSGGGGSGGSEDGGVDAGLMCGDCSQVMTPQCFTAVCDEEKGECAVVPSKGGEACDDGLFCTSGETCNDGVCGEGSDNLCGLDADACHAVACDELADACALEPLPDGTSCTANNLCVVNAACKAGACVGAAKDCFFAPVPDVCHVSACDPATGKCEPVGGNDGTACPNAGDPCKVGKKCLAGECTGGVLKDCSALTSACNLGACEAATGQCVAQPFGVGDACLEAVDECNTGMCDANGACVPVPTPGVACPSQTNDCNAGVCGAAGVCEAMPINEAGVCEDGNSCTTGETCAAGVCTGGVLNNYFVYFNESFADNSAGWTFNQPGLPASQEWQIGPAAASVCQSSGGSDPPLDHSIGDDNGVAGVAIGGCPVKELHSYYYLESPVINAEVQGSVWLEYWRFLNSDFKPYMRNSVEVFDGATWVKVWESGGLPPIKDASWTRITHDLTAYKGANMRVRFGFEVQNTLGFTVSAWNIDDLVISNNICN